MVYLFPVLLTISLHNGQTRFIAAKTQVAGIQLALDSFGEDQIKKINVKLTKSLMKEE